MDAFVDFAVFHLISIVFVASCLGRFWCETGAVSEPSGSATLQVGAQGLVVLTKMDCSESSSFSIAYKAACA
jgi:hypothetical protein